MTIPTLPYIYRALIEDIVPGGDGRCRIRIFGLNDNIPSNLLPIAEPAWGLFGTTDSAAAGSLPVKGMWVWVFFDGGNIQSPVYFAYAPAGSDIAKSFIETPIIDLSNSDSAQITFPGGCELTFNNGSISLNCSGTITIKGKTIILN